MWNSRAEFEQIPFLFVCSSFFSFLLVWPRSPGPRIVKGKKLLFYSSVDFNPNILIFFLDFQRFSEHFSPLTPIQPLNSSIKFYLTNYLCLNFWMNKYSHFGNMHQESLILFNEILWEIFPEKKKRKEKKNWEESKQRILVEEPKSLLFTLLGCGCNEEKECKFVLYSNTFPL